jgi:hypothetical protein
MIPAPIPGNNPVMSAHFLLFSPFFIFKLIIFKTISLTNVWLLFTWIILILSQNVNAFNRRHVKYVRHVYSAHRTGPYLCQFEKKCRQTLQDRGKLLQHIKEAHFNSTGKLNHLLGYSIMYLAVLRIHDILG